jgi:myo-inositol-1(or 4)-monophosphatase
MIVEEAGGRVSDYQGRYYPTDGRETMASNGLIHEAMMQEFAEIFAGRGSDPLPDPRTPRS